MRIFEGIFRVCVVIALAVIIWGAITVGGVIQQEHMEHEAILTEARGY